MDLYSHEGAIKDGQEFAPGTKPGFYGGLKVKTIKAVLWWPFPDHGSWQDTNKRSIVDTRRAFRRSPLPNKYLPRMRKTV